MPWLVTHTGQALNTEHVQQLYTDKSKIKAAITGFPVTVAADLAPEEAARLLRTIVEELALGFSVEVVGGEIRRLTSLR